MEAEGEDLAGMSWIPSETTRLGVALVSLCHGKSVGAHFCCALLLFFSDPAFI